VVTKEKRFEDGEKKKKTTCAIREKEGHRFLRESVAAHWGGEGTERGIGGVFVIHSIQKSRPVEMGRSLTEGEGDITSQRRSGLGKGERGPPRRKKEKSEGFFISKENGCRRDLLGGAPGVEKFSLISPWKKGERKPTSSLKCDNILPGLLFSV